MARTNYLRLSACDVEMGEVALLGINSYDEVTYTLGDAACAFKGATKVGQRSPDWEADVFFGWHGNESDLPGSLYRGGATKLQLLNPFGVWHPKIQEFTLFAPVTASTSVIRMPEAMVIKSLTRPFEDSLNCDKCKEPVLQASPNMADGSFRCYSCRNNPYR